IASRAPAEHMCLPPARSSRSLPSTSSKTTTAAPTPRRSSATAACSCGRIGIWSASERSDHAELVLFRELVIRGHCSPNTRHLAESVPNGPSVERLAQIAWQHRLIVCAGLSEKERDIVYNTQVLVEPEDRRVLALRFP